MTSNSDRYPVGYMDREMFQETYDRLIEENVLEDNFNVDDAFSMGFLDNARG